MTPTACAQLPCQTPESAMNIVPTRLFQDETTDNNEPRSRSLPAPTSGITIDNRPDVYDMTNNHWEDDYDWFDLDEMPAAERGEETTLTKRDRQHIGDTRYGIIHQKKMTKNQRRLRN